MIQKDYPNVKPVELEDCVINEAQEFQGDLSKMAGWLDAYSTYDAITPPSNPKSTVRREKIGDVPYVYFENESPELPNAIIFRDSFFTVMQPFLAQNFNELIDVKAYIVDLEWIEQEKPDIVIFLMTERIIQRLTWFPN